MDEGRALAGEEVVLQRAGRVLAGDGPGGGIFVLLAVRQREGDPRVGAARVLGVPRGEARLALAPGEEQDCLAGAEQTCERPTFAADGHLRAIGPARVL